MWVVSDERLKRLEQGWNYNLLEKQWLITIIHIFKNSSI